MKLKEFLERNPEWADLHVIIDKNGALIVHPGAAPGAAALAKEGGDIFEADTELDFQVGRPAELTRFAGPTGF